MIARIRRRIQNFRQRRESAIKSERITTNHEEMAVRTQQEVQSRFCLILQTEGSIYRKAARAYLRPAKMGEEIVTVVGGKVESTNIARDDTSYVVCGKVDGEEYILTKKDFEASYDESSAAPIDPEAFGEDQRENACRLRDEGFLDYKSKRMVWAKNMTREDMEWFCFGEGLVVKGVVKGAFIAPWGEKMLVEEGDPIVMQYPLGNTEIYRVEDNVFGITYEALDTKA